MILLSAFLLAGAGFTALALAMDRHHRQVCQRTPSRRQRVWLRVQGAAGLTAALTLCIARVGWGVGIVIWLGLLTLAGLVIVLTLAYWQNKPRRVQPLFKESNHE